MTKNRLVISHKISLFSKAFTLIEMVVFIAIVSLALTGVLAGLNYTTASSANPLVRKQALAIAESLMQEIQQMPTTYCDPNDGNASIARNFAECASASQQTLGPIPSSESRYSHTNPLDNKSDYHQFRMPGGGCAGICHLGDTVPIAGLDAYAAEVQMRYIPRTGPFPNMPNDDSILEITITVTGPAETKVVLTGYSIRYAPRV